MFGTLAVPVLRPVLRQVDVAGRDVVGEGINSRPVAAEIHEVWKREEENYSMVIPKRRNV